MKVFYSVDTSSTIGYSQCYVCWLYLHTQNFILQVEVMIMENIDMHMHQLKS